MRFAEISAEVFRSFSLYSPTLQAMSLGQKISKPKLPLCTRMEYHRTEYIHTIFFVFLCYILIVVLHGDPTFTFISIAVDNSFLHSSGSFVVHAILYLDGHTKKRTKKPTLQNVSSTFVAAYDMYTTSS